MRYLVMPFAAAALLLQTGVGRTQVGQYPFALTQEGQVLGVVQAGVASFKGLRYAAAPIGALRWRPPQPPPESSDIRTARDYGPACPQPMAPGSGVNRMSEDCLTLNLFKPFEADDPLPVMVWLHGGSFVAGSAAERLFDGAKLAQQGVIVITLNYRLGAFGWLADPSPAETAVNGRTANYGMMDQIAALRWIRDNIAAFGGDPDNVMLFGAASGAASVALLMLCEPARGLFRKAILESVPGRERVREMETTEAVGRRFLQAVARGGGGNDPRAADSDVLLAAEKIVLSNSVQSFGPTRDGMLVTDDIAPGFEAGRESRIPLIIGSNEDETTFGAEPDVREELGDVTDEARKLYPEASGHPKALAARLYTDRVFTEPARFLARRHAATGAPVFRYRFSYVPEAQRADGDRVGELPFVFGADGVPGAGLLTQRDREVSNQLRTYWTNFAKTGNPNGPGLPPWEDSSGRERLLLISNAGISSSDDPWSERLDRLERRSPKQ
ncbi:MAG: carboxylesterase/lipase family protein [Bradyrhizobium sp.]|uniref:carboxylesterase/lipase family protein n=1 Tax=Bradyrhizobium sp. TaxID=376 RepID=UPI001D5984AC|nr:carboxylesterase family protein [Bradyrhizobium sp.]MBV9562162.1 carboxylesterase/lipase family protein [Bradyrhizobium sp.]